MAVDPVTGLDLDQILTEAGWRFDGDWWTRDGVHHYTQATALALTLIDERDARGNDAG